MRWLAFSRTTVLVLIPMLSGAAQAGGDPARGAEIFRQNCSGCHSPEPGQNLVGPTLFSVVGRPAGTVPGFSYSTAMKSSGITWTPDRLMAYLEAPRKYLPGIKMPFAGLPDERDRRDVIAFLATLSIAANRGANARLETKGRTTEKRGGP